MDGALTGLISCMKGVLSRNVRSVSAEPTQVRNGLVSRMRLLERPGVEYAQRAYASGCDRKHLPYISKIHCGFTAVFFFNEISAPPRIMAETG